MAGRMPAITAYEKTRKPTGKMAKSNAERLRNHHSIYLREGVWSGVRHHAGTRLKDDLT